MGCSGLAVSRDPRDTQRQHLLWFGVHPGPTRHANVTFAVASQDPWYAQTHDLQWFGGQPGPTRHSNVAFAVVWRSAGTRKTYKHTVCCGLAISRDPRDTQTLHLLWFSGQPGRTRHANATFAVVWRRAGTHGMQWFGGQPGPTRYPNATFAAVWRSSGTHEERKRNISYGLATGVKRHKHESARVQ